MATEARMLFNNSELALAAYADLDIRKSTAEQLTALTKSGMTQAEADAFAFRYPKIIAVIPDTDSGFSATVFKSSEGKLSVAIRGTAGLVDLASADFAEIVPHGAAYSQIVDMYNWWMQVSSTPGSDVQQYSIEYSTSPPDGAVQYLFAKDYDQHHVANNAYLVLKDNTVTATGECYGASIDVTSHSLGGHLAGAFAALFSSRNSINNITTFNAPGFTHEADPLFAALGGLTPFAISPAVTRVRGDEALPDESMGQIISGLHTPIGVDTHIAIENQYRLPADDNAPAALNHSQGVLVDSLAVFNTLAKLNPGLRIDSYNQIFHSASNINNASLESMVEGLAAILGINIGMVTAGDSHRDSFYQAIYAIQTNSHFKSLTGVSVLSSEGLSAAQAKTNFSAFMSLQQLSPIYLAGVTLSQFANASTYQRWLAGEFSTDYLNDCSSALHTLLSRNKVDEDETDALADETIYYDYRNNREIFAHGGHEAINSDDDADHAQVHLGSATADKISGGKGNDRFYGGAGKDHYRIDVEAGFGHDVIEDVDGGSIDGLALHLRHTGPWRGDSRDGSYVVVDANGNLDSSKSGWTVMLSGDHAIVTAAGSDGIISTLRLNNFDIATNNFGISFEDAPPPPPLPGTEVAIGDGITAIDWNMFSFLGYADTELTSRGRDTQGHRYMSRDGWTHSGSANIPSVWSEVAAHFDLDPFDSVLCDHYRDLYNSVGVASINSWIDEMNSYQHRSLKFNAAEYGVGSTAAPVDSFGGATEDDVLIGQFIPNVYGSYDGNNGDDLIAGDSGNFLDEAYGYNDTLVGGRGNDTLYGQGGDDRLYAAVYPRYVLLDDFLGWPEGGKAAYGGKRPLELIQTGVATMEDIGEHNFLSGGDGNDKLVGASYGDILLGGKGSDYILAGAGRDVISGGDDVDIIYGDSYVFWRNVNEVLTDFISPDAVQTNNYRAYFYQNGHNLSELLLSADYNDVIDGDAGRDIIFGELGNDIINGGKDADTLFGDRQYNSGWFTTLEVDQYQKLSAAYHGNDVIDGGANNDFIIGGGGDDVLFGGEENSNVAGGNGDNDTIYGDLGLDIYDMANAGRKEVKVLVSQAEWWGKDTIFGGLGKDKLIGEGGNDVIDGGDDNDTLFGDWDKLAQHITDADYNAYGGNDNLSGGAGNDVLYGGEGSDRLNGGAGSDTLNGENGDDIYIIGSADGQDTITDTLGDNTLAILSSSIEVIHDASTVTIYTAKNNRSQYVQMTEASYATFKELKNSNGDALEVTETITGSDGVIHVSSGAKTIVVNNGSQPCSLQLRQTLAELSTTQLNISFNGLAAEVSITKSNGENTSLYIDNWSNLKDILDADGHPIGFILDAYDAVNHVLAGRNGDDVIDTGNTVWWSAMGAEGDDHYFVKDFRTIVTENGNAGQDTVSSYGTFSLGDHIENLTIMGPAAYGYGNASNNTVSGSAYDDVLFGLQGDDGLFGRDGHDELSGGNGNDLLVGGSGDDILNGGKGSDSLNGGSGSDTYRFIQGHHQDTISNVDDFADNNNRDVLVFELTGSADYRDLWLHQENNDLVISLHDSSDRVTVKNWFAAQGEERDENELDAIRIHKGADIRTLDNNQASVDALNDNFDRLLQAMASWEASHPGLVPTHSALAQTEYESSWLSSPA